MHRNALVLPVLLAVTAGCAGYEATHETAPGLTPEQIASGVQAAMDTSADPCVDFYRYSCGGWLEATERPADQSSWTRSFNVVIEQNREVVREILENAAADPGGDPDAIRIGQFYESCMNEEAINTAGAEPLGPIFEMIGTVNDGPSLMSVTAILHRRSIGALFDMGVIPDFKDPDLNILFMFQGGLGMPDRDYYLSDDEKKQELMREYEPHVARMLGLLGEDEETATRHAAQIVAFETELAKVSRDRTEMRVIEKLYNRMDAEGLAELTPALPWGKYFHAVGHHDIQAISVATPEFFDALEGIVAATEPDVLQTYLRWNVVNNTAGRLSDDFVNADFDFYGKKIAGQEQIKPRWKRCVTATSNALGESIGKLFVERMFSGGSKEIAMEMIGDLKTSFAANLPGLEWMDDVTRERATGKLDAMGFKIGYPDEWRDYSAMKTSPADYFGNAMAANEFEFDFEMNKVDQPVDRKEWGMTPQMVNAYHNPLMNEMVYPAGILQPPFFHRDFPAAMNYGAIGGGIGHELTHGFDDQGRKFDAKGTLSEWWEPEVADRFDERAQCVDRFYSEYEVAGANVNGALTLGENIADIGGLKQSYEAYKTWEERHGVPEPAVEGLTNDQLVFVAWGQVWCTHKSDEAARLQVTTDPHSPAQFRVNGPVSHNPHFARAFGCEAGDPMVAAEQCTVW